MRGLLVYNLQQPILRFYKRYAVSMILEYRQERIVKTKTGIFQKAYMKGNLK